MFWLIAVQLITVHMVDGREVHVNPQEVTRLSDARDEGDPAKKVVGPVHCIIYLSDGKYVSVAEDCSTVRELMEGEER